MGVTRHQTERCIGASTQAEAQQLSRHSPPLHVRCSDLVYCCCVRSAFWWQNVRESYYPAVQAGDYDVLRAMFGFYQRLLRVQEMRVHRYYGHDGAYFEEVELPTRLCSAAVQE